MLLKRTAEWERISQIAELCRGGILDMSLLRSGDVMRLISSVGEGYAKTTDRVFDLHIQEIASEGEIIGVVTRDTYNDLHIDHPGYAWAVPKGETVRIVGSSKAGEDARKGLLVVGRHVDYAWRDSSWGINLQEVVLYSPDGDIQSTLFGTDPRVYRPSPIKV